MIRPTWGESSAAEFQLLVRDSRTPKLRSPLEFAESECCLPKDGGPFEGLPFRADRQPWSRILLDAMADDWWLELVTSGPSQSGKTYTCFALPIIYHTAELREPYIVGVPDLAMCNDKWRVDIEPVFLASPMLRRLLPISGAGSRGGKISEPYVIRLRNGVDIKFMTAGGDDTTKAGFTSRVIGITEAARFSNPGESSVEAGPLKQLQARQKSHKRVRRRSYIEGTHTILTELPWILWELSSQSRLVVPCPHCRYWVCPGREDLVGWQNAESEQQAADQAAFACPKCKEPMSEEQRRSANDQVKIIHKGQTIDRAGRIRGDRPATRRLYFHYTSYHNCFLDAADFGVEEWQAAQIDEDSAERQQAEKALCQFSHGIPYEAPVIEITPLEAADVIEKASELPRGLLPSDTRWVTLASDCGMYRLHWTMIAWRANRTGHIADYGTIEVLKRGEGTAASRRKSVRREILRSLAQLMVRCKMGWQVDTETKRRAPDQVWIDCRYLSDEVAEFCKAAGNKTFRPFWGYGSGQSAPHKYTHPTKRTKTNDILFIGDQYNERRDRARACVAAHGDADHWKSFLHDGLATGEDMPGSITLFADIETNHKVFAKHLTAEKQIVEHHPKRGPITVWVLPEGSTNHFFDSSYMACAAGHRVGFRINRPRRNSKQLTLAQLRRQASK